MKRIMHSVYILLALSGFCLTGCEPPNYQDGSYEAQSSPDEDGNYGRVKVTLEANRFISVDYQSYNKDGTVKDENYGRDRESSLNKGYYRKAQFAIKQVPVYAKMLLNVQDIDDVDTISGATIIHDQFEECIEIILDEAEQRYEETMKNSPQKQD